MVNKILNDPEHSRTLFVLFPCNVKDQEEVKKLHPGIEAVRFTKRAQRWCHIRFKTEALAKQAQKELHKKKIKSGRLIVSQTKARKQKELKEKSKKPGFFKLFISNIPTHVTKKDIKATFRTSKSIRIIPPKKDSKTFKAFIVLHSFEDAQDILSDPKLHKINGKPVTVQFTKTVLNITQKAKIKIGKNLSQEKTLNDGKSTINHKTDVTFFEDETIPKLKTMKAESKKILEGIRANEQSKKERRKKHDTSLNKVAEVTNMQSHVMQNYRKVISRTEGKEYSSGNSEVDSEEQEDKSTEEEEENEEEEDDEDSSVISTDEQENGSDDDDEDDDDLI